jgi:UDP-3-O-[3-hydroxymyristoyl] glucosamine N-acyltransferase
MALTLGVLAEEIGGKLRNGDPECEIISVATLQRAASGDISFLANTGYRKFLPSTRASAVILGPENVAACPVAAIVADNPYVAYARAAELLTPPGQDRQGVHATACIGEGCQVDATVWVGPHCVIEDGASIHAAVQLAGGCFIGSGSVIGAGSRLSANVVVYHDVTIGARVQIAAGAVIGSDGFGLANEDGKWIHVPQLGGVRIGDDVDIGANTTIDRGALEDTVLEEGVRLDNQIQVAHNVHIGAHTAIAGCVGISGSARIGKHCMIGGGAGIVGHLEIADHVVITGMTMVTKSITRPGVYSSGLPAQENDAWNRNYARFRQLDRIARKVQKLERSLASDREDTAAPANTNKLD